MIYDCFLFNNELEVLSVRLHELDSVVDKFVITESTVTHMNKPKRLYYSENKHLFSKFRNKIIHNVIKDSPDVNNPWILNDYQFSNMARGLLKCNDSDIILFGDVDEIPSSNKVREWSNRPGRHKIFKQWLYFYFFNFGSQKKYEWSGTHMLTYKQLKSYNSMWIAKYSKYDREISEGGWHFSYIGGVKRIQKKISSQAHQEYNTSKYNTPENIRKGIIEGKDFMGHGNIFKITPLSALPMYIQENVNLFRPNLMEKKPSVYSKIAYKILLPIERELRLLYRKNRDYFRKNG